MLRYVCPADILLSHLLVAFFFRTALLEVLNGIIWILISGSLWYLLPKEYPPYQTSRRYFQQWVTKGLMQKMLGALSLYHARGRKNKEVDVMDGSFSSAKKGR